MSDVRSSLIISVLAFFNLFLLVFVGGMQEPGDGFLQNLQQPGRMTGRLPVVEGVPMVQENTLMICFPENP